MKKDTLCFIKGDGVGNLQVECINDMHCMVFWQLQIFFFFLINCWPEEVIQIPPLAFLFLAGFGLEVGASFYE